MAKKKDNLPINSEDSNANGGTITYAPEVIAIIAGVAANEVEGLAGMCTSGGLADIMNKNKNITRGVKVDIGTEEVSVELYTIIEYDQPIQKVALEVQENVRKNIEAMTGLHVVRVDVFVQGVSFEKEKMEVQKNLDSANKPSLPERDTAVKHEDGGSKEEPESVKNNKEKDNSDDSAKESSSDSADTGKDALENSKENAEKAQESVLEEDEG